MKNKEKYAKEIVEIVCEGCALAVSKETGKPVKCVNIKCSECTLGGRGMCSTMIKEWAESKYIEKPVISKKDRAFFDCLVEDFKYIARDKNNSLYAYDKEPHKVKETASWAGDGIRWFKLNNYVNVDFPMIKWSDDKPWLIDDLKKLEVVEEYEIN